MSAEGVLEPPDGEERSLASTVMVASDCCTPVTVTLPQVPGGSTEPGSLLRAAARESAAPVSPLPTRNWTDVSTMAEPARMLLSSTCTLTTEDAACSAAMYACWARWSNVTGE